jgi:hypothetical protein
MAAIRRPIELPAQRVRFATLNDQDGPLAARQVIAEQPDACLPMVRIEHHGAAALSHPGTTRSVSSASETSGDGSARIVRGRSPVELFGHRAKSTRLASNHQRLGRPTAMIPRSSAVMPRDGRISSVVRPMQIPRDLARHSDLKPPTVPT